MTCRHCGGQVEWQGPLSNLTHTKCLSCGNVNCQELDYDPTPYCTGCGTMTANQCDCGTTADNE